MNGVCTKIDIRSDFAHKWMIVSHPTTKLVLPVSYNIKDLIVFSKIPHNLYDPFNLWSRWRNTVRGRYGMKSKIKLGKMVKWIF